MTTLTSICLPLNQCDSTHARNPFAVRQPRHSLPLQRSPSAQVRIHAPTPTNTRPDSSRCSCGTSDRELITSNFPRLTAIRQLPLVVFQLFNKTLNQINRKFAVANPHMMVCSTWDLIRHVRKIDAKFWSPTGAQNATETYSIAACNVDGPGKIVRETTVARKLRWPGFAKLEVPLARIGRGLRFRGVHGSAGCGVMEGARNKLAS